MNKIKKRINIKQVCPSCSNEFIIKDFDLFMDKIRDSWALASTRFKFNDLPKHQQDFIRTQNNEEKIEESLKKGYVKIICQPCGALLFYEGIEKNE